MDIDTDGWWCVSNRFALLWPHFTIKQSFWQIFGWGRVKQKNKEDYNKNKMMESRAKQKAAKNPKLADTM